MCVNAISSPSDLSDLQILEQASAVVGKGGPGCFADLDMLEVGNGGLSDVDARSHFSLWALLKSPLILGTQTMTQRR